jgi:hypothetical protein
VAKPDRMSVREACALLRQCVRLGCLGEGDARAVGVLIREAKRAEALTAAADDVLGLLEAADLEGTEGEGGRIEALRKALD